MIKNLQLGVKSGIALALLCALVTAGCEVKSTNGDNQAAGTPAIADKGTVLFTLPETVEEAGFTLGNLTIRTLSPGEWVLDATSSDPLILLPELEYPTGKNLSIEIDATVPVDSDCQVFYLTPENNSYDGAHLVSAAVTAGRQTLKLDIQANGLTGRIRVDLGKSQGSYVLHGLTVTAL